MRFKAYIQVKKKYLSQFHQRGGNFYDFSLEN